MTFDNKIQKLFRNYFQKVLALKGWKYRSKTEIPFCNTVGTYKNKKTAKVVMSNKNEQLAKEPQQTLVTCLFTILEEVWTG